MHVKGLCILVTESSVTLTNYFYYQKCFSATFLPSNVSMLLRNVDSTALFIRLQPSISNLVQCDVISGSGEVAIAKSFVEC